MMVTVAPWPEVAEEIQERFGYRLNEEYDLDGDALEALVDSGFDIQIRHKDARTVTLQISPQGRGFSPRG